MTRENPVAPFVSEEACTNEYSQEPSTKNDQPEFLYHGG